MEVFEYYILTHSIDPKYCLIEDEAKGVEEEWNLIEGNRMGDNFPEDAAYYMSHDHKGMKLSDFLSNYINLLMISNKVRDLMRQEGITDVEFLPFTLYDKKGRIASQEHCIANMLGTIDCLDLENSIFVRSHLDPEDVLYFKKVALKTKKIPSDKKLFRLKEMSELHIVRSDFVTALRENSITGYRLINLGEAVFI